MTGDDLDRLYRAIRRIYWGMCTAGLALAMGVTWLCFRAFA